MTDYVEDQMMEAEALESIYMDEFTKFSDTPLKIKVHIVPNQDGGNNHVALSLVFTMPETYPDTPPQVEILLERGLSDRQQKEIRVLLDQQIEENIGMAMVYTVCEALREYLVENNREGNDGSEYQEMLRRQEHRQKVDTIAAEAAQLKLDQESENSNASKNTSGTPVTLETFMAWKTSFDAEMASKEGGKIIVGTEKRLTGRQLWTSGAAKEDSNTDVGDIEIQGIDDEFIDDEDDENYINEEGDN